MLHHTLTCLCNLDGAIVAESAAQVPVLDRGFLFGDSVYEVVRTRGGHLFAWREHLQRLAASANALGMNLDLDEAAILRRVLATVDAADNADSYVRIVVTRGTGTAPSIDLACAPGPLRWVILVRPLPTVPPTARLAVVARLRNDRRALDPATKSGNYLNNVLGLAEAQRLGATDCVFLNGQGGVTEASTSNLFAVIDGSIVTPPLSAGILAGITRAIVLQFLREQGTMADQADLTLDDLRRADELFLTGTLRDVAPVTYLDGRPLHGGGPGPKSAALAAAFRVHADRRAAEIDGPAARRAIAG
jgi:branched-chain amino acid aminotransferase